MAVQLVTIKKDTFNIFLAMFPPTTRMPRSLSFVFGVPFCKKKTEVFIGFWDSMVIHQKFLLNVFVNKLNSTGKYTETVACISWFFIIIFN